MRTLPTSFRSDGFDYVLLKREGLAALFQKSKPSHSFPTYEIVWIRQIPTRELFGHTSEAHEAMPSSEQWGTYGWTACDLPSAESRFTWLVEKLAKGAEA